MHTPVVVRLPADAPHNLVVISPEDLDAARADTVARGTLRDAQALYEHFERTGRNL